MTLDCCSSTAGYISTIMLTACQHSRLLCARCAALLLQFKNCVVRFGSGEAAEEFIALVEKHKPEA